MIKWANSDWIEIFVKVDEEFRYWNKILRRSKTKTIFISMAWKYQFLTPLIFESMICCVVNYNFNLEMFSDWMHRECARRKLIFNRLIWWKVRSLSANFTYSWYKFLTWYVCSCAYLVKFPHWYNLMHYRCANFMKFTVFIVCHVVKVPTEVWMF